ncbi:MAG: class I SAM-dependent methyltransferase [Chloroflexi bacterium]|nr:class I SAM-dependent methyltransferase [Chloroflexota bacterium]MBU1747779.1 class I SAM-dependent methyltransferase [Chloroflexota bacterium]MBU1880355.1 class I SAM-dependent methyltransferase [Chloroflexota bacterium]
MSKITPQSLSGVTETLLITLYIRALESQRPDALLTDENAVALVRQMDLDPSRVLAKIDEETRVATVLRNREFDRHAKDFLALHPEAVVVHIGCGLDARFERVAERNDQVEWYDLDLPEVIELRRQLIGGEGARQHFLAGSVLDSAWLDTVSVHRPRPFLFLAEGVLMYLEETQVKSLVLTLRERFPGAELVFDAFSPFFVWANNRRVTRTNIGARCHWALKRSQDLESWGDGTLAPHEAQRSAGVCLLDEWFPFRCPEPRLGRARWVRHIPLLAKTMGVFHYRLGKMAG